MKNSRFDRLFNTIMEDVKSSKIKAKKVIKESEEDYDDDWEEKDYGCPQEYDTFKIVEKYEKDPKIWQKIIEWLRGEKSDKQAGFNGHFYQTVPAAVTSDVWEAIPFAVYDVTEDPSLKWTEDVDDFGDFVFDVHTSRNDEVAKERCFKGWYKEMKFMKEHGLAEFLPQEWLD